MGGGEWCLLGLFIIIVQVETELPELHCRVF